MHVDKGSVFGVYVFVFTSFSGFSCAPLSVQSLNDVLNRMPSSTCKRRSKRCPCISALAVGAPPRPPLSLPVCSGRASTLPPFVGSRFFSSLSFFPSSPLFFLLDVLTARADCGCDVCVCVCATFQYSLLSAKGPYICVCVGVGEWHPPGWWLELSESETDAFLHHREEDGRGKREKNEKKDLCGLLSPFFFSFSSHHVITIDVKKKK